MSLQANITYTIGSTQYVIEPSLRDVLDAVAARAVSAGRSDLLPVTLPNLEDVLIALGGTVPVDKTLTVGSTTFIFRTPLEQLIPIARAVGA